ncbi:MAG: choice-of-anchor J domain-containing protein, partial [Candidatus Marinimicrobia bacterium]|nr:choice-of-anchor J domain-containing protein [Candidatus Neomarinimicrobiota bacterium]
ASFSTVVYDSATFTVDMVSVPNICPARNLSVVAGDARNFLDWTGPIAMSNLNPFPSAPQSVNYHTGSTDGSSLIQNSLMMAHGGGADKEAGWAIFDLAGMNPSIEVDSIIFNYYVNTTNWPYWSATAVDLDPLTATASDLHTEILDGTDAGTAYLYMNESSSFAPGWYSNALINGANDDLEDDIPQGYFVIGVTDRDGSATYFLDIDGWNEANPPSLDIHWSAPGGRQGVFHAPSIEGIPYSDEEIMVYKNAISEGLTPPLALAGIGSYEMESTPNLSPREVIEGCGDFQNYSVYTSDGTEVATTDTNYYLHESLTNGTEYCYYIVVNYTEGASSATSTACATPETFIPGAITNLNAVGLDEEIAMSWTDPSVPQYSFYENFNSGIPTTWTVVDNNSSGLVWVSGEDGPSGYTLDEFDGLFAIITSYSNTFPNTDLISPSIDLSGFSSATLHYTYNYQDFAGNPTDSGSVYISGDGGATWTLMNTYTVDTPPGGLDVALADTASLNSVVGSSDVKIKFHYEVESGESWFFAVDDIIVIGTDTSGSRDMTGSTVATMDTYIPGNTHTMEFSVNILAPDFAYSDSLALTFPAGVTILDAGPDFLGFGGEPYGPEPYNGISGQTISWGTNANDGAGGIFGTLTVWATLAFDSSVTGPLSASFHVSDDWYNTPLDIDGNFAINERDLIDGDMLGYNVYIDGSSTPHNTSLIEESNYLAGGLTNGQSYTIGVTAVYYPNYESSPLEATASPTWLFGDISGTVMDPNGNLLDSAIVRTGTFVDTTGTDGVFLLQNLIPGDYTVSVMRQDFENDAADVTVVAQEAATTNNFVLTPSLARASGLEAFAGDHQIDLIWNKPGSSSSYDLAYYDDAFEGQIGCGGDCEFGVRFTPLGYPAVLTTLYLSFQGDAGAVGADIFAYIDDSGSIAGPGGITPVLLATGVDLSSPDGSLVQYEIDVSAANVVVNSGDVYISVRENNTGFMGIANDTAPQSPEFYDRNWVGLGDGSYMTIFDAVGGDPSLTGDFGVLATFDGPSMAAATLNNRNEIVLEISSDSYEGIFKTEVNADYDIEELGYERSINPDNVIRLTDIRYPEPQTRSREDSLIGYNVYQSLDDGDTLVTTTTSGDDTTAIITVPANYVEYCYNIRAKWNTDNYGILEAKPTSDACAIPYTLGDVDFNSGVDLSDLLTVVDFVLEVSTPSESQFRGADVNMDATITINDVVMIVDIIYGTNARTIASTDVPVLVDLL